MCGRASGGKQCNKDSIEFRLCRLMAEGFWPSEKLEDNVGATPQVGLDELEYYKL